METSTESNMVMAVVQAADADIAVQALKKADISSYQMPSVGGFLGRRNITLIIEVPQGRFDEIKEILANNCRQRIEFVAVPIESTQIAIPQPTQIPVGGAVVFGLTAERIEKF